MLLGIVFYQLNNALFPEPKTVIGPISKTRIHALQQQWQNNTGHRPSPHQLTRLIEAELNHDVLLQRALELKIHLYDNIVYQRLIRNMHFLRLAEGKSDAELFEQALEMRLHLDDTVVRRRLIQVMEQRLLALNPPPPPGKEEIEAEYERRFKELRKSPLYSFEHLFFNPEREHEVASLIAKITEQKLDFQTARHLNSPYLQGYKFRRQTPRKLAQNFGNQFVQSLEQRVLEQAVLESESKPENNASAITQQWLGPIRSAYGLHYVWMNAFEPARDAPLEEVEQQLRNDLNYAAQAKALLNAIANLRRDYIIKGSDVKSSGVNGLDVKDSNTKELDDKPVGATR